MRHVAREHRGELRFERKTVEIISGYVPPAEEMFGGSKKGKWRRTSAEEEVFDASPPSRTPSLERSISPERRVHRQADTWVRERDGRPEQSLEWSIYKNGGESWVRDRDGTPPRPWWKRPSAAKREPSPTPSPSTGSDLARDDGAVEVEIADDHGSPSSVPDSSPARQSILNSTCISPSCKACRRSAAPEPEESIPPPSRFELYGSFRLMDLPLELREIVYDIAISDAITTSLSPDLSPITAWTALPLLQTNAAIRAEASRIYAATTHFSISFRSLSSWSTLVGPRFLTHIRRLTITFPPNVENARMYDFTDVYRLKCHACPRATLTLTASDRPKPHTTVTALHWSQTGDHAVHLSTLLNAANVSTLRPLFESPTPIITEIFVNVKGELVSVKATEHLYLTYDDLYAAFGGGDKEKWDSEVKRIGEHGSGITPGSGSLARYRAEGWRLSVNELPWQMTALATTMAPRTGRKKEKTGAEEEKGFGGGLARSWGMKKAEAGEGTVWKPVANSGFGGFAALSSGGTKASGSGGFGFSFGGKIRDAKDEEGDESD